METLFWKKMASLLLPAFCLLSGAGCTAGWAVPDFGNVYHVSGVIDLPFAEIQEPFEAWYNLSGGKSRIQYYHGQVVTFQYGAERPFGALYKITPETTELELNIRKCFRISGSPGKRVYPQSVFPRLDGFKLYTNKYLDAYCKRRCCLEAHHFFTCGSRKLRQPVWEESYKGQLCTVWQNVSYWGQKKNVYTLWVASSADGPVPVHYEMRGFNSLLGSHYDKYEINYSGFTHSYPAGVLDLPSGMECEFPPGDGVEHRILANPMWDFVGRQADRGRQLFHHYRREYRKEYGSRKELEHRAQTFVHNMRFVHSKNRANLPYKLALNHLADRTPEEMAVLRGRLQDQTPHNGQPFPLAPYAGIILPESLDWRLYGAVTPVKDQALCGSCWSFAAAGGLEGALFLKTGVLTPLSQQALIDCSWGFGNHGCDGGLPWRAFKWVRKHGGIPSAEAYGPYRGQNGYCHYNSSELLANIRGHVNIPAGDVATLRAAIFKNGPVAVSIDASAKSFIFYSNGIYYEPQCGNTSSSLNHAVLAVGYGVLQGDSYWLIKNSWSTYWGNDGYILMSMQDNNCGVATAATYPVLA
ncbi:digestive cysteine proteinase 2-like isoform X1 [Gopherus evgoodei]|uniref:digestive cysteine proteinase 2-like isoform X1 n=1 Tax=Gopherus evgoodei TaxID=1825980 RepID=UPI0011CF4B3B|nr:digestive cysteine proteinase 2-like isoform X1 [Gopherus evgoodei]